MEKTKNTEAEVLERAEKIKQLVLEKARYQKRIEDIQNEIEGLTNKISDLDSQISSLLGFGKMKTSTKKPGNPKLSIPKKGMVMDMAKVMSENKPMTKDEIMQSMTEQEMEVNPNSIRSYLTNLKCFENIKKSDPKFDNKKGWICHKEMLK